MKTVIREIIISLFVCIAVILLLGVAFYNYIPSNKIVPEKVTYEASKEIKEELNTEVQDDSDLIIKTYEITASDLETYEKTNEYNPGKANPFAPVSTSVDTDVEGETSSDDSTATYGETITGTGTSSETSGGTLFETGDSK